MKILSLHDFIKTYKDNRIIINATLQGQTIENSGDGTVLGISIVLFLVFFILFLCIWIWALVATVKYWKLLPDWAKVVSILGLIPIIPGGPIVTLVVVYISKQK